MCSHPSKATAWPSLDGERDALALDDRCCGAQRSLGRKRQEGGFQCGARLGGGKRDCAFLQFGGALKVAASAWAAACAAMKCHRCRPRVRSCPRSIGAAAER